MDKVITETNSDISTIEEATNRCIDNISKVIVGKKDVIEMVLVALLCKGHILIEDVPGTGKTVMARAAARSLGCDFKRIQCTPDLLPSDATGIHYFNQKTSEFEFRPGPIVSNIVLVDEINRATPRTQSCLLECMQEQQLTVDLETISLPQPFLIIATQNPIELEGTFPLPEAQLDRFLLKISLGYPSKDEEDIILSRFQQDNPLDTLASVTNAGELMKLQELRPKVHIDKSIRRYIIAITRATREHHDIKLGASPRASLGLNLASQALAAIRGRSYVIPDDVKYLAIPALAHRLIIKTRARLKGKTTEDILREILETIPVPVEETT